MTFRSILFESAEDRPNDLVAAPDYFADLNCDQIVDAITAGKEEYNLKPYFYERLSSFKSINYRHMVMQDLESPLLLACVSNFAQTMRDMRQYLTSVSKLHYKEQREVWFLEVVENYCNSISSFAEDLSRFDLKSPGFAGFRDYLGTYTRSVEFETLQSQTRALKADLLTIRYEIFIKDDKLTVRHYADEADYSVEVAETFEKFAQGAARDYRLQFRTTGDMNHVEAKILEFVANLNPEIFSALAEFCAKNANFQDQIITDFDREVQFYVAYLDYLEALKRAGLPFCYPFVSDMRKDVLCREGFDIALAHKLVKENSSVVCNDFYLTGRERILVVSGPNQGGKTTFARMFGQLHYLASIGCPVPGREARLFHFDQLFTHFEKEEKVENLRGKLEDDLLRTRNIFRKATSRSVIIMNEVFTSTTLHDELFLSKKVMELVVALDLLCVWVTFVDELASFGPQTVSMVSTVVPENPALRTFKVVRQPADGLAYAMAIAKKYRLTYGSIIQRMTS